MFLKNKFSLSLSSFFFCHVLIRCCIITIIIIIIIILIIYHKAVYTCWAVLSSQV